MTLAGRGLPTEAASVASDWRRLAERWDSSAFAKATAGSHLVSDAIPPKRALSSGARRRVAERVGFEPTCPCGQDAFEAPPLRPLRYLSVYWRSRPPAARLGSLHSLPLRRVAPFRSRLGARRRPAVRLARLGSLPLRRVAPFRSRLGVDCGSRLTGAILNYNIRA
jgi:hypothetical protein